MLGWCSTKPTLTNVLVPVTLFSLILQGIGDHQQDYFNADYQPRLAATVLAPLIPLTDIESTTTSTLWGRPATKTPDIPLPATQEVKSLKTQTNASECEQYRELIAKHFPAGQIDTALSVMRAESGCNTNAIGDGHLTYAESGVTYGMSCGLMQVRFLPGRPSCEELKDPVTNVTKAGALYRAGGWSHWTVCTKGMVSCV